MLSGAFDRSSFITSRSDTHSIAHNRNTNIHPSTSFIIQAQLDEAMDLMAEVDSRQFSAHTHGIGEDNDSDSSDEGQLLAQSLAAAHPTSVKYVTSVLVL